MARQTKRCLALTVGPTTSDTDSWTRVVSSCSYFEGPADCLIFFACELCPPTRQRFGSRGSRTRFPFQTSSGKKLTLNQTPVITVTGKAFFDVGHSLKDQRSNREATTWSTIRESPMFA